MAQGTKGTNGVGNTKQPRVRNRNWCFTLNNYTEAEVKDLQEGKYDYVFQEETGESGTDHLQGVVFLKNPVGLAGVKKINGRAHWEVMRGTKAEATAYCCKEDTRTGAIYSNIEYEKVAQGTSTKQKIKTDAEMKKYIAEKIPSWIEELVKDCEDIKIGESILAYEGMMEQKD